MIRYDKTLRSKMDKYVTKYNKHLSLLQKAGYETPDKITFYTIKDAVNSRDDINRYFKMLDTFIDTDPSKTSTQDYLIESIKRYQNLAQRRINKDEEFYKTHSAIVDGTSQSLTMQEARDTKYLNLMIRKEKLLDKDLKNKTIDELEHLQHLLIYDTKARSVKKWQNTYSELLEEVGRAWGVNENKIKHIQEKLSTLSPNEFNELYKRSKNFQNIVYNYHMVQKAMKDSKVKLGVFTDEVIDNFDALDDNIDKLVEEVKGS